MALQVLHNVNNNGSFTYFRTSAGTADEVFRRVSGRKQEERRPGIAEKGKRGISYRSLALIFPPQPVGLQSSIIC